MSPLSEQTYTGHKHVGFLSVLLLFVQSSCFAAKALIRELGSASALQGEKVKPWRSM